MKIDLCEALGVTATIFMEGEELRLWNERLAEELRLSANKNVLQRALSWQDFIGKDHDRILH